MFLAFTNVQHVIIALNKSNRTIKGFKSTRFGVEMDVGN